MKKYIGQQQNRRGMNREIQAPAPAYPLKPVRLGASK